MIDNLVSKDRMQHSCVWNFQALFVLYKLLFKVWNIQKYLAWKRKYSWDRENPKLSLQISIYRRPGLICIGKVTSPGQTKVSLANSITPLKPHKTRGFLYTILQHVSLLTKLSSFTQLKAYTSFQRFVYFCKTSLWNH